jgi:predicted permease
VTPRRRSWSAQRAIDLALLAYPRAFRDRFGAEMRADLRTRTPRDPGTLATIATLVTNGLVERAAAWSRWSFWPSHRQYIYQPALRRSSFWDARISDVRYTLRLARTSPAHVALVVAAMSLGIGANSAIFTVVERVLLRPLPYASPEGLVVLWSNDTNQGKPNNQISPANFVDLREATRGLATFASYFSFITNSTLTLEGQPEIVAASVVEPAVFDLLGRRAALGRATTAGDTEDRVVLSDGFWRRRFGADPSVIGRTVTLDSRTRTIVGVMPADFVFPYKGLLGPTGFTRTLAPDVWMPLWMDSPSMRDTTGQLPRSVHFLGAVGRLRPGVTVEQTRAALITVAGQLESQYPETNKGWTITLVPLHEQVVGAVRPALVLLAAGVGLLLLMACANVANLVLARSLSRRKELAVRAALGARGTRLAAQAITEALLLSLASGLASLLLVSWAVRALVALAPPDLPRLDEVSPDLTVFGLTLLVSLATGALVGLVPALSAARTEAREALQEFGRGTTGSRTRRQLRSTLVVTQIALAVVLTVGAGLLLRSFNRVLGVNAGFDAEHLLTLQLNLPRHLDTPDKRRAFYTVLFQRLERLPGVVAVGGTTRIPLGSTNVSTSVEIQGQDVRPNERPEAEFRRAMHDYFSAMGIPLVRGRMFTAADGPTAPPVAIVNETMARQVFHGGNAVGQRVRLGPNPSGAWISVVGVVGDVRHSRLDSEPLPEIYINYLQNPPVSPFIVIRSSGDPADLASLARHEARAIEPALTVYDIRTMMQIKAASVAERRFLLRLIGLFDALSLVLAGLGVYGVMLLVVSERTQEMGVRLALGAEPLSVMRLIVGQALRLAVTGVLVGLAVATALSPLMASLLFGVGTFDTPTFTAVPLLLVLVATTAAFLPARRAMRVDPMLTLRAE